MMARTHFWASSKKVWIGQTMNTAYPKKLTSCPICSSPAATFCAPSTVSVTRNSPENSTLAASTVACQRPADTAADRVSWDWTA